LNHCADDPLQAKAGYGLGSQSTMKLANVSFAPAQMGMTHIGIPKRKIAGIFAQVGWKHDSNRSDSYFFDPVLAMKGFCGQFSLPTGGVPNGLLFALRVNEKERVDSAAA
jgi:hypothetical protein